MILHIISGDNKYYYLIYDINDNMLYNIILCIIFYMDYNIACNIVYGIIVTITDCTTRQQYNIRYYMQYDTRYYILYKI